MKGSTAYKRFFIKAINIHFPDDALAMISEVEVRFTELSKDTKFAATSSNPIDKRLDFCAYFLALIKTLERKGASYEQIRTICLGITIDYVSPKNFIQKWLKRLPPKLIGLSPVRILLKVFNRKISKKGH